MDRIIPIYLPKSGKELDHTNIPHKFHTGKSVRLPFTKVYPLVMTNIANDWKWQFIVSFPISVIMVIFHRYVCLPEDILFLKLPVN